MEQDVLERKHVSRRGFLAGTGALVVAIAAPRLVNPRAAFATLAGDFPIGPAQIDPTQIDSWVAIGGDGLVTIFTGKEEQGTGVGTAQMQLAADELDVPLAGIKLIISDTFRTPDQGFSAGQPVAHDRVRSERAAPGVRGSTCCAPGHGRRRS